MSADRRVVLDASALLAWVMRERGAETIDVLLPYAVVPVSALVETLYRARELGHGLGSADLHRDLLSMGIAVEPVTELDALRAADLIAASRAGRSGSLSLGDGLCLAVAERIGLTVTGGDQLWETLDLAVDYRPFR